jgi:hypothetical protein
LSQGQGRSVAAGGPSLVALSCAEPPAGIRRSTVGRPRRLTDRQVALILDEYARYLAWLALRTSVKSQRQLARELGVSQSTISLVIRSRGQYKQGSPDLRSELPARRR